MHDNNNNSDSNADSKIKHDGANRKTEEGNPSATNKTQSKSFINSLLHGQGGIIGENPDNTITVTNI